jgi:hypothetical protein
MKRAAPAETHFLERDEAEDGRLAGDNPLGVSAE